MGTITRLVMCIPPVNIKNIIFPLTTVFVFQVPVCLMTLILVFSQYNSKSA